MKIPKPLLNDITIGTCLPFIGAGFSLNCNAPLGLKMPDWKGLMKMLADEANIDSRLSPPKIASLYERRFGRVQLIESIRCALHVDEIEPGDAHRSFASLSFETVYTTNFDFLLESAFQELKKPFRPLVGELQMPFHGGPSTTSIIKMHGDLRHEEHIIVTEEDFNRYLKDYPIVATHLSAMLITKTGLFIGYSLSDPDFQHIREVVRSRLGKFERRAYIVQFNISPQDTEKMFRLNLHPINLKTNGRRTKAEALIELFQNIQIYVETQEAYRLRKLRPEAFEPLEKTTLRKSFRVTDSASLLTSSSNLCFVIMPFRPKYELVYRQLVIPATATFGLKALRADDIYSPGIITEQIRAAIHQSRICVAEITDKNSNVLYEVGIAHTLGKPTILLSQEVKEIPFDLRALPLVTYRPDMRIIKKARIELEMEIRRILGRSKLVEAEALIRRGDTRTGIALTGIYLEHALRELLRRNESRAADLLHAGKTEYLTMGQMLKFLSRLDVISKNDVSKIRECIVLRNKAVHELKEPKIPDAKVFIDVVGDFVKRYLGEDFNK